MEDLWRRSDRYSAEPSSCSQATACLPHYRGNIDTIEGIQIRTAIKSGKLGEPGTDIDVDATAAKVFDAFANKSPYDYGLLGTASSGPVVQLDQAVDDNSSRAVKQCSQKIVANVGDQARTLTCNSRANSLLNAHNPFPRPTRNAKQKKGGGGGRHDSISKSLCTENGHVHKLVERQRRDTMKTLCSTLISLLPEEYHKTRHALSDQLLEVIKYIDHLENTLIEVEKKRDELCLSGTVKPFSNSSRVCKNLQVSQTRPSDIVPGTFPTIRVSKFGSGIQVTVNAFKNQIEFASLLMVLEEAEVEVVSATVSAINDSVFYTIHSKLSGFFDFDSAVLHGRIEQLVK